MRRIPAARRSTQRGEPHSYRSTLSEYTEAATKRLSEVDTEQLARQAQQAQQLLLERGLTAYEGSKQLLRASHTINQYVSLAAGAAVCFSAWVAFWQVFSFQASGGNWLVGLLTQVYIFVFGVAIILMEVPLIEKTQWVLAFKVWVDKWLRAFSRLTARAFVYFTHAVLIVDAQDDYSRFGVMCGYLLMIAGLFALAVGLVTTWDLMQLKQKVQGAKDTNGKVRKAEDVFRSADKDSNETLSKTELMDLVRQHNPEITDLELDFFFLNLDEDRDGQISLAEFMVWYDSQGLAAEDFA